MALHYLASILLELRRHAMTHSGRESSDFQPEDENNHTTNEPARIEPHPTHNSLSSASASASASTPAADTMGQRISSMLGTVYDTVMLRERIRNLEIDCSDKDRENAALLDDNDRLKADIRFIHGNLLLPYVQNIQTQRRATLEEVLQDIYVEFCQIGPLKQQVTDLQQQGRDLQQQRADLQQELLAKREQIQATSDEQLAQDFQNLASAIKTISRTMKFDARYKYAKEFKSRVLVKGVKSVHWTSITRTKQLFEAVIWSYLIVCVFRTPFKTFGSDAKALTAAWRNTFGVSDQSFWPPPSTSSEAWRRMAVEELSIRVNGEAEINERNGVIRDSIQNAKK